MHFSDIAQCSKVTPSDGQPEPIENPELLEATVCCGSRSHARIHQVPKWTLVGPGFEGFRRDAARTRGSNFRNFCPSFCFKELGSNQGPITLQGATCGSKMGCRCRLFSVLTLRFVARYFGRELRRLTPLRTEMRDTLSCPVLPRGNANAPTCVRQRTPLWLPYIWASQRRRFSKAPGSLHRILALP